MHEVFAFPAYVVFVDAEGDDSVSAEEEMHVPVIGPLVRLEFPREEVEHAVDLENDLALQAKIYVPALEKGLDGEWDFEPAQTIEDAHIHLALDGRLDCLQFLGSGLNMMFGVAIFDGRVQDGKAVDVGSVGLVKFPEEFGQNWCLQFCLRKEGEALRVGPRERQIAEMIVMGQNRVAKMLALLVAHQSLAELLVSLEHFDHLPQQGQLAVFSLFSVSRNREGSIDDIAAQNDLIDVVDVFVYVLLHNKLEQSNCVLIFSEAAHSVYLHQLAHEFMEVHKSILLLHEFFLQEREKDPVELFLEHFHDLYILVDLDGFVLELRGNHRDHKREEAQRNGIEVGLEEMDDCVLDASPFGSFVLAVPESLEIADYNLQSPLIQAQVFQLVSDDVLHQNPAYALKLGRGQVGAHLECDQDVDLAGRGKIVKCFIALQVRGDPRQQGCVVGLLAVEGLYDVQGLLVEQARL